MHNFPKFGVCGSNNKPATPFRILNLKWVWQAQFLSHNFLISQNCIFFEGKQMIVVSFSKIHEGIKVTNFCHSCHIHILSHSWLNRGSTLERVSLSRSQDFTGFAEPMEHVPTWPLISYGFHIFSTFTPLGWGGFKFENWWTWPNYMGLYTRIIAVSL